MLTIRKTGESYYLATLQGSKEELGRAECHYIKKELAKIIKSHREISLDLKGVKRIDSGGLNILGELKALVEYKKCKLRFINVSSSIANDIAALSGYRLKYQGEISLN